MRLSTISSAFLLGCAAAAHLQQRKASKTVTLYDWSFAPGEHGVIMVSQFLLWPDEVLCAAENYTLPSPRFPCNDTAWEWSLAQTNNTWDMHLWYTTDTGTLEGVLHPRCNGLRGCEQIGNVTGTLVPPQGE
ncbi:265217e6-9029-4d0d-9484-7abb4a42d127 [Thermothielavioides terrestris]|uniref:265217e6-9029-4d0d-9484-7abb4a42d127 n=1 Tax=Thermothielavioides terrestris TaxID=2587410 RepID=A0A3S5CWB6_9PEZI|nr:265217e6-9029-4d0d-9484-7abb4a42d127 [Thermothielavioides terrestris]